MNLWERIFGRKEEEKKEEKREWTVLLQVHYHHPTKEYRLTHYFDSEEKARAFSNAMNHKFARKDFYVGDNDLKTYFFELPTAASINVIPPKNANEAR